MLLFYLGYSFSDYLLYVKMLGIQIYSFVLLIGALIFEEIFRVWLADDVRTS